MGLRGLGSAQNGDGELGDGSFDRGGDQGDKIRELGEIEKER